MTGSRLSLLCGAVAGPLFTLAWILEGASRADYHPILHPISSLSIGVLGWTQSATFLVVGTLTIAFSLGLRTALRHLSGSRWAPVLFAAAGVGLVGAGLFVTDPMNGYPPGTPLIPLQYSLPGRLHRLFSALFFLSLPIASFVLARLFARSGHLAWRTYSMASGIAFLLGFVLTAVGFLQVGDLAFVPGLLQRITLTVGWLWMTLLAIRLLRNSAVPF